MEKSSFTLNGGVKLPIGYRFHPTDEELTVHYLKRKVFGIPLPASVIPEFDVFQTNPRSLPGDLKEKRYFFCKRKGNENNKKCKRAAGSGYWKPMGKDKQIIASESNQAVGMRKTLVFCEGKRSHESKTQWIMHEYCLVGSVTTPNSPQIFKMEYGDWVVYRVFQRKRKPKTGGVSSKIPNSNKNEIVVIKPTCIDLTVEDSSDDFGPPQPSSPSSTDVTEVSFGGLDQEETSAYIDFSSYSCMQRH